MFLDSVVVVRSQANFANLSLFICHLFVGGNFRVAHILYHPEAFDDRLISEIDSSCSIKIPTTTIDVTSSELDTLDKNERTDHILHLIFLPKNHLSQGYSRIRRLLGFYRVYVFLTPNHEFESDKEVNRVLNSVGDVNAMSLAVAHDVEVNSTQFYHIFQNRKRNNTRTVRFDLPNSNSSADVFSHSLGEKAMPHILSVISNSVRGATCLGNKARKVQLQVYKANQLLAHLYYNQLNLSFILEQNAQCIENEHKKSIRLVKHIPKPIYKELSFDYKPIAAQTQMSIVEQPLTILSPIQLKSSLVGVPFYVGHQMQIRVIFIHGINTPRQSLNANVVQFLTNEPFWPMYVLFLSLALVLYRVRCHLDIPNVRFVTTWMEVCSVAIGGGRFRCRHKWERILLSIAMIGSFFLVAVILAKYEMHSVISRYDKVDSFAKLAERDVSFYFSSPNFKEKQIAYLLRYKLNKEPHFKHKNDLRETLKRKGIAIVLFENTIEIIVEMLRDDKVEFDIIEESLGEAFVQYYVGSDTYVAQRTVDKFSRLSNAMLENGLHKFYSTIPFDFKKDKPKGGQVNAISLQEFYFPMAMCFYYLLMAFVILIIEIAWMWLVAQMQRIPFPFWENRL